MEKERPLSIYSFAYNGHDYIYENDEIKIKLEETRSGYQVYIQDMEGNILTPKYHTEAYDEIDYKLLRKHFTLNNALRIANSLYREYYPKEHGSQIKRGLHSY